MFNTFDVYSFSFHANGTTGLGKDECEVTVPFVVPCLGFECCICHSVMASGVLMTTEQLGDCQSRVVKLDLYLKLSVVR